MAYEIETKDGIVIRGIPDNIKPDDPSVVELVRVEREKRTASSADRATAANERFAKAAQGDRSAMPTDEKLTVTGSFGENALAGAGKAMSDLGLGVKQIGQKLGNTVGLVDDSTLEATNAEATDRRQRDAALMRTGGGITGNIAGNIAMTALPGAALARGGALLPATSNVGRVMSTVGQAVNVPRTFGQAAAVGGGLGALQPVTGEGGELERLMNAGMGAAGGALGLGVGRGIGAAVRSGRAALEPFFDKGQEAIIGRALTKASGGESGQVVQRLRDAATPAMGPHQPGLERQVMGEIVPGSLPTVGQAAQNPGIAALERAAVAIDPVVGPAHLERMNAQNAARASLLARVAGDDGAMDAAVAARSNTTRPLRDAALREANYGSAKTAELEGRIAAKNDSLVSALQDQGRFATTAAEQSALSNRWAPTPGLPRVPGRLGANAERVPEAASAAGETAAIVAQRRAERDFLGRQLESLRNAGYSPLKASGLADSITETLNQPGIRASDVVRRTLGDVREKIASLAGPDGTINAADLYTVRKELGNTIATHAKETANWDKRLTSGLERDIQKSIDSAMERAGAGDLWRQYLASYQTLSRPINQMETGRAIASSATNSKNDVVELGKLAKALQDATAARATGFQKATLENTFEPQQLGQLRSVLEDLQRADLAKTSRVAGSDTAQKLAYSNLLDEAGVPTWLRGMKSAQATTNIGARLANALYGGANKDIAARLATTMMDPGEAARMMTTGAVTPVTDRLIRAITDKGLVPLGIGGGVTAQNLLR